MELVKQREAIDETVSSQWGREVKGKKNIRRVILMNEKLLPSHVGTNEATFLVNKGARHAALSVFLVLFK